MTPIRLEITLDHSHRDGRWYATITRNEDTLHWESERGFDTRDEATLWLAQRVRGECALSNLKDAA